jgi:hypothetical protein
MKKHIPISVAYKKKTGSKVWIKTFTDQRTPDRINAKKGTLLPAGSEIIEMGVGSKFEERYKQKYG